MFLSYSRSLWRGLTDVFDIYLKILRRVQQMADMELGRLSDNYRMLHSCPPCQYKLEDEPLLEIEMIGSIDGNQSLRRADLRAGAHEDPRQFRSSYLLSEDAVNVFQHDIKPRCKKSKVSAPLPPVSEEPEEAGAADGDTEHTTCADRWQAAAADVVKRMWKIYRESGIFLAACRHGFVWIFCDMIKSGELAKYGLAILNELLQLFGKNLGIGYDIACAFMATVRKSSLAAAAAELRLRLCVPAFHGFAHNRPCQLSNHPLYITGFGIEDLETCEKVFAPSNGCAKLSRHATRFHRHQSLDMHFTQWDEDKYAELATFLFNNYQQAQGLLNDMPTAIAALQSGKALEDTVYHEHLDAERLYLASRKKEPESDVIACEYVALLIKYEAAGKLYHTAMAQTVPCKSDDLQLRLHKVKLDAFEQLEQLCTLVVALEKLHDFQERWTPSDKWKAAVAYMEVREYQKALDKLEGLVVQRLFELTKMGLAGTGYKMRVHINKALKTRCKAIQTALKKFNTAACILNRPPLEWKNISTYGSLAEFSLLRECREDIRSLPWAEATNRQAAIYHLKYERALEERERLNLEVRRLATWVRDEEHDFTCNITRVGLLRPHLAAEMGEIRDRRVHINNEHRKCIARIQALPSFSGISSLGTRIGRTNTDMDIDSLNDEAADGTGGGDEELDDDGLDEDDRVADELVNITYFVENLAIDLH
ncbi:hypothetical protein PILCRDRAFT_5198 [Piloderma croceum F 1598]|uniref:CxC1-like cysteine cluster associated with KDZ transposases domain-containing protein n=1 Tax=Piloderma croceum (strain F 1598) TaxID=765440 RepID=A0A0C3BIK9_PILCF|nr:hypothetical protein PILCRDRAFT_5198 [Piloderma croceum F 1598]